MSLAIWNHSVTCYSTQVNTPRLNPSQKLVLDLTTPEGWKAGLTWVTCYIPRWFTCPQAVTHPSTNRAQCWLTTLIESNALATSLCRHPLCVNTDVQCLRVQHSGCTRTRMDRMTSSVGIAGEIGGVQPPVHFFNPPSLIYSFVLGESENDPPDCTCIHYLCHHSTSTISVSSLSKILYRYSIMIAVKIENLWFQLQV